MKTVVQHLAVRTLLALVVFLALSGDAATIKLFTDYPNGVPVGSDFLVYQRNSTFGNASVSQMKSDWFNNPVFTGSGGIQGNWRVDSFVSIGGNLVFGGIGYGDGSGFTNITGTATTTYISNFTNNTFTTTNVAFINIETNNTFVNTNTFISTSNSFFNNTYITNITIPVPGGATNLNLTPNTLMYADVNDAEASLPNAVGVLTNDGSGAIGYSTSLSFDEFDADTAYMTNVFTFLTNAPFLATDGDGKIIPGSGTITNNTTIVQNLSATYITNTTLYSTNIYVSNLYADTNYTTNLYVVSGKGNTMIITNLTIAGSVTGDGSSLTNLTIRYDTNAVPNTGVLTFGHSYWTNLQTDITLPSFTLGSAAYYESMVLEVTNSTAAVHTVTVPSGVRVAIANGGSNKLYCTNGTVTELVFSHYGNIHTNAWKNDF